MDTASPSEEIVGGRWKLVAEIGRGATGSVYEAEDLLGGPPAALKRMVPLSTVQRDRVLREIAALRLLRLPGVVQLLDEGEADGQHYIAMELVRDGVHFPGPLDGRGWEALAPRATALLQILARVHAAGVIHRDLKPANVLVDGSGAVFLVDFGLARGPALDQSITAQGGIVGTPWYLSPEQFDGQEPDARCDLYSVGVMLFEALAGRRPHSGENLRELYFARVGRDATPLELLRPDLPPDATRLVNTLLSRNRTVRPRSANEALALLGGGRVFPLLPRLGGDGPVRALVDAALAGRAATVEGPTGAGRSRALREAAEELLAKGREVAWAVPGERPFESLLHLLGAPEDADDPLQQMVVRLAARLSGGLVLVVDAELDPWSARVLGDAKGAVLGVGGDVVTLAPLDPSSLRPLFRGPDRLLHLAEDGARELYRRAGGLPARVVAEVEAWVAAGLAELDGERIVVERGALDRLAGGLRVEPVLAGGGEADALDPALADLLGWVALAGPHAERGLLARVGGRSSWELALQLAELQSRRLVRRLPDGRFEPTDGEAVLAHWDRERRRTARAAMAAALPPGADGRLAHLLGADDDEGAVAEALLVARGLVEAGHLPRAIGVLEIGLLVARNGAGGQRTEALLCALSHAAIGTFSVSSCERAAHELGRAVWSPRVARWKRLVEASAEGLRGRAATAIPALEELGAMEEPALEEARLRVLLRLLSAHAPEAAHRLLDALQAWAVGDPRREGLLATWRAGQAYREERYADAAALQAFAAERLTGAERLVAQLGHATALLDDGRLAEARSEAHHALELLGEVRHAHFEARVEWILRSAAYRAGEDLRPDEELLAACELTVPPWMLAQVLMTEAGVAWRAGMRSLAGAYAERAALLWDRSGFGAGAVLVHALAVLAAGDAVPDSVVDAAMTASVPGLSLQALGLLALADPRCRPRVLPRVEELLAQVPHDKRTSRLEILAPAEALSYCRA